MNILQDACRIIMSRLAPVMDKLGPNATWAEIVLEAYHQKISLSATGFGKYEFVASTNIVFNITKTYSHSLSESKATYQISLLANVKHHHHFHISYTGRRVQK